MFKKAWEPGSCSGCPKGLGAAVPGVQKGEANSEHEAGLGSVPRNHRECPKTMGEEWRRREVASHLPAS